MLKVFDNARALGEALASEILSGVEAASVAGRPYLLGCPGGRSLQSTYEALSHRAAALQANLSGLVIVMMDDYVLPEGTGFVHCPPNDHYSCRRFGREDIVGLLNQGLPQAKQIPLKNLWFPDPANTLEYEQRLKAAGGIDLFLLASGASDGHVAFNPPGSSVDSLTRIIPLAATTRVDNMQTFPDFKSLDQVPGHGVSVGVGTIIQHSKDAVMVIHGAHKQGALKKILSFKDYDPAWPASLITRCVGGRIYTDRSASGRESS
ncbi:MAG: 6-phosphogluconolactonase [candidate division FCPU426 bacterium]